MIVSFKNYLKSPSGIFATVAILLAIFFYWSGQKSPNLTMYEFERKTIIASPQDTSQLKLFYKNREVKEEVVATQLVIWNSGSASVKKDMILEQVELVINSENLKIFEVKINETTRKIIGFNIDQRGIKEGIIPISWKILEPGDGVLIQVIHTKKEGAEFSIQGIIEEQGAIRNYEGTYLHRLIKLNPKPQGSKTEKYILFFSLLGLGVMTLFFASSDIISEQEKDALDFIEIIFLLIFSIVAIIYSFMWLLTPIAPF